MQEKLSKSEKFHLYNSLASLLKSLENRYTIIDLRNESCVSGLIKNVDGFMNVEMENAVFYDPRGNEHTFDSFYISARNIRYAHIPKDLSPLQLMKNQIAELSHVPKKIKVKPTHKANRAKRYNEEIKSLIRDQAGPSSSA